MRRLTFVLVVFALVALATVACSTSVPEPAPTPTPVPPATPDTEATVAAAVAATSQAAASTDATAQAAATSSQATVEAAVAATGTSQAVVEATIDAAVEATRAAAPTPTPAPEFTAMTESEMAAAIDESASDAQATTQQASNAAVEAAADGTVTQEEVEAIELYLAEAESAIVYTEDLLYAYYGLYADLAVETLYLLEEIEDDLTELTESADALYATLDEIDTALQQGLAVQQETVAQLEQLAQAAYEDAAQFQSQAQGWEQALQAELQQRTAAALAVQPDQVPATRKAALQSATAYLESARQALADSKLSAEELANIAQLGANAAAGLNAQALPQIQQLAGAINELTALMAGGAIPQVQGALGSLEAALGALPSLP